MQPLRPFRTLSALDVYRRLVALEHELQAMADEAMGVETETALRASAEKIRLLASAVYSGSLKAGEVPPAEG